MQYHTRNFFFRQEKECAAAKKPPQEQLLLAERLAVGARFHRGICLMGTHQDPLQRAEIRIIAVVCTLLDSAFDTLVCMTAHVLFLLFLGFLDSIAQNEKMIHRFFQQILPKKVFQKQTTCAIIRCLVMCAAAQAAASTIYIRKQVILCVIYPKFL